MSYKIYANLDSVSYQATLDINKYNTETKASIKKAVADGVQAIKQTAIRMAPNGTTGNLKAGITSEMSDRYASGEVKSTAPHSHLVEFGTGERIVYNDPRKGKKAMVINGGFVRGDIYNGKMQAKPFLRPALESERDRIEENIRRVIDK